MVRTITANPRTGKLQKCRPVLFAGLMVPPREQRATIRFRFEVFKPAALPLSWVRRHTGRLLRTGC